MRRCLSAAVIAQRLKCSEHKINYWLNKHSISKRSISDALYAAWNPKGDPFSSPVIHTKQEAFLYGIGLGLYWGEGNKSNKLSVRLGNTDPELIKIFLRFLRTIYRIDGKKLQFGLQIFSDMSPHKSLQFWQRHLKVSPSQFYKVVVTPARSLGTYRIKNKHGVLTVHFNNRKLRDIICHAIEDINGTFSNIA